MTRLLPLSLFALCIGCGSGRRDAMEPMNRALAELHESGRYSPDSEGYRELTRLTRLAVQASKNGDDEQSEHFQALVTIQIAVLKAEETQRKLNTQIDATVAENHAIEKQIETLRSAIRNKEIEQERTRIRAHVVSVVDESRRKAAAEEEMRARFRNEKFKTARFEVGNEMLTRARVLLPAVAAYLRRSLLDTNEVDLLYAAATAAENALEAGDLFQVQMITENLTVTARDLLTGAWPGIGETTMAHSVETLAASLTAGGLTVSHDRTGCRLTLGSITDKKNTRAAEILAAVAARYRENPSFLLQLFSTASNEKSPKIAKQKSEKTAAAWAERLIALGIPDTDIGATGCGAASPFHLSTELKSNTVLLLVPIPDTP